MRVADHTGKIFGLGTVTERAPGDGRPGVRWKLRCECGNTYEARGIDLTSLKVRSCGCLSRRRLEDLTGRKFNRWTAVKHAGRTANGMTLWECRCDCGTVKVLHASALKSGHTRSCGCLRKEIQGTQAMTHGHARAGKKSKTYTCWQDMCRRCMDIDHKNFKDYGLRGIKVCGRWQGPDGFTNFLADMGEKPPGLTIDREDNDGDYEPENCRWATKAQQARNKRNTVTLTRGGETRPLAEWAEILGIKPITIHMRLRAGWTHEEALGDGKNRRPRTPIAS